MQCGYKALGAVLAFTVLSGAAGAQPADSTAKDAPGVVATIPAVHSIVSGVLGDKSDAHLLVPGNASPHSYNLRPSDARALGDAKLVVWVGPELETFLDGRIEQLAPDARVISLMTLDDAVLLPIRVGGLWDAHDHGDHGHGDHGHGDHGHDHAKHHDHADEHDHKHDHAKHSDHTGEHDSHSHISGIDGHAWLDPRNAIALSAAVAEALSEIAPADADFYAANHAQQIERLNALDVALSEELAEIKDVPFIVFHDAYQYFENRYGLGSVGSVTVSPEVAPGVQRVRAIQSRIAERGAKCVFAEPQFRPAILDAVIEGTDTRVSVLDPVGADLPPGAELYGQLMHALADNMRACLSADATQTP